MALPRTTLVFAIATCIPFGLAIRDSVRDRPAPRHHRSAGLLGLFEQGEPQRDDDAENDDAAQALREFADRQAELAATRDAELRARDRVAIDALVGRGPAALGPLFGGIHLGDSTTVIDPLRAAFATYQRDSHIKIQPLLDGETLQAIVIDVLPRSCEPMAAVLVERWGPALRAGERSLWIDERTRQRASYEETIGCTLRLERIASIPSWIGATRDALVPVWAIGNPVDTLVATIGDRARVSNHDVQWTVPGIGFGTGETQLRAEVRGGKVASVSVTVEADMTTQDQVIGELTRLRGHAPAGEPLAWPGEPRIVVERTASTLFLTIGNPPED
ncbi:MAG TPA: hypothetical protein VFQ53_33835 [Kofleriaceae bacterium]|nr:hypothetical protein [Kofleriaceae bacterium]